MKIKKLSVIALIIALAASLTGFAATKALKVSATSESVFKSIRLNVSDDISLKYDVALPSGASDVKMTFSLGENGAIGSREVTDYSVNGELSTFVFDGVTPQYMGETITAKLTYTADGETVEETNLYSVKEYCMTLLEKTGKDLGVTDKTAEDVKKIAVSVLNYGAATQNYAAAKGEETGALANADLTKEQTNEYTLNFDDVKGSLENKLQKDGTGTEITWKSAAMLFDYNLALNVRFTVADSVTGEITAKVNDEEATVKAGENGVYVVTYPVSVDKLDEVLTVAVYADGVKIGSSLLYSAASYVYNYKDSETEMATLAKQTYVYGKAVENYIDNYSVKIQLGGSETASNLVTSKGLDISVTYGGSTRVYKDDEASGESKTRNTASPVVYYGNGSDYGCFSYLGEVLKTNDSQKIVYATLPYTVADDGEYDIYLRGQYSGSSKTSDAKWGESNAKIAYCLTDYAVEDFDNEKYTLFRNGVTIDAGHSPSTFNRWYNCIDWSVTNVATVTLKKGSGYLNIQILVADQINLDYFVLAKKGTYVEDKAILINTMSGHEEIVKAGGYVDLSVAKDFCKNVEKDGINFSGYYVRIPSETYGLQDVPVTIEMLEEALTTQKLTVEDYTVEGVNFFDSGLIDDVYTVQAEGNAYKPDGSAFTTSEKVVDSVLGNRIYNGSIGSNVSGLQDSNFVDYYMLISVDVEYAANYNLISRTQFTPGKYENFTAFSNIKISVNGGEEVSATGYSLRASITQAWKDQYHWSFTKLGTVWLNRGKNVIKIRNAHPARIPNFDYFMLEGLGVDRPETEMISVRNAKEEVKVTSDSVLTVKKGSSLAKSLQSATGIDYTPSSAPVFTGLYIRVKNFVNTLDNKDYAVYMQDVPVLESGDTTSNDYAVITSVDYNTVGEQTVTVTYAGNTYTFKLNVTE